MSFKLQGGVQMKVKLRDLGERAKQALANAVYEFEQVEMKEMQRRVPVATGDLRDSGYYTQPIIGDDRITAEMGFTAEYALFVHEDLEAFHTNGEAKFMESVMNESLPHLRERIVLTLQRQLGL